MNPRVRAPPALPPARCPVRPPPTQSLGPDSGASREQEGWGRYTWSLEVKSRNFFFFFFFSFALLFFLCWLLLLLFKVAETRQEAAWEKKVEQKWKNTNSPAANGLSVQTKVFSGAFPRARPLPPARAPRSHTHPRTRAHTHALAGEGRAASTACSCHTINNNRFLRLGLLPEPRQRCSREAPPQPAPAPRRAQASPCTPSRTPRTPESDLHLDAAPLGCLPPPPASRNK